MNNPHNLPQRLIFKRISSLTGDGQTHIQLEWGWACRGLVGVPVEVSPAAAVLDHGLNDGVGGDAVDVVETPTGADHVPMPVDGQDEAAAGRAHDLAADAGLAGVEVRVRVGPAHRAGLPAAPALPARRGSRVCGDQHGLWPGRARAVLAMRNIDKTLDHLRDRATDLFGMGRSFERLTRKALKQEPGILGDRFTRVWLWDEWPDSEGGDTDIVVDQ